MAGTRTFIALDIGAGNLKLALFERHRSGQIELVNYRFMPLEAGAPGMAQEAVVAASVKRLLDEMKISASSASVTLAGHAVFSRVVKLPPVSADKLEQTVRHEAIQNIPFPIDEVVWDYQLMGDPAATEREALLVAAKLDLVEGLAHAVEAAGLSVERISVSSAALCNAVRFGHPGLDDSILVVDMGARSVDLVFMAGGRAFFRSLPIRAKSSGGGAEEAQRVLTRIEQEIVRSISFYIAQQQGRAPEVVFLAGGLAGMQGIDSLLSERLKVAVKRLDPLRKMKVGPKVNAVELQQRAHCFGELVGMAVAQASQSGLVNLNLMPGFMLKERAFRKKQPLMVACAAVVVLFIAVIAAGLSWQVGLMRREAAEVGQRVRDLEKIEREMLPVEQELDGLERDRDVYLLAVKRRTLWLETLAELRTAIPEGMFLTSVDPIFSEVGEERWLRGLRVSGIAYLDKHGSDDAIKKLRNRIRELSRFSMGTEVVRSPAKEMFAREFVMDAQLKEAVSL